MTADGGLAEVIRRIVDGAPPLPDAVVQLIAAAASLEEVSRDRAA